MMDVSEEAGRCVQALQQGGVILFPAATGWCFGCDATNTAAVDRMLQCAPAYLHACSVLVAEERDVLQYTAAPDLALFDYLAQQDKPITVLFKDPLGIAPAALLPDGSVAIRMVQDAFCRHMVKRLRKPVACVPAMVEGQAALLTVDQLIQQLTGKLDYAVPQTSHMPVNIQPITLIRWENGQPVAVDA